MNKKLDKKCRTSGLEKREIAKKVGITSQYLSELIAENYSPSLKVVRRFLKLFKCKFEELF